jgi:hypothetical protein
MGMLDGFSSLFGGGTPSNYFNQRSGASGGIFSNVLQMFTQPVGQIGDGALGLAMAPLKIAGGLLGGLFSGLGLSSLFNSASGAGQQGFGITQNDPRLYSQSQQLANNNYAQPNPIGNFFSRGPGGNMFG